MQYNDHVSPICLPEKGRDELTELALVNEVATETDVVSPLLVVPEKRMPPPPPKGLVVGWGAVDKFGDGNNAARRVFQTARNKAIVVVNEADLLKLRKVELPFVDRFTCERWYASRGRPIRLVSTQFCAGMFDGGKDACRVSFTTFYRNFHFYTKFSNFPFSSFSFSLTGRLWRTNPRKDFNL